MKNTTLLIALVLSFISIGNAQTAKESIFKSKFGIGLETQSWHYEEFRSNGKTFMKDFGQLYGAGVSAEGLGSGGTFVYQTSAKYLAGSTRYEGGLQDGRGNTIPYSTDNTENRIFEASGTAGLPIQLGPSAHFLVPKLGLSLRYLHNPEHPEEKYDYDRKAVYLTLPIAVALRGQITDSVRYHLGVQYDILLSAATVSTIRSYEIVNEQEDGSGYKVHGGLSFKIGNNAVALTGYYRRWDFEDSNPYYVGGSTFIEPKNVTDSIGVNASFHF